MFEFAAKIQKKKSKPLRIKKNCIAVANFSLFTFHFSLFYCTFAPDFRVIHIINI